MNKEQIVSLNTINQKLELYIHELCKESKNILEEHTTHATILKAVTQKILDNKIQDEDVDKTVGIFIEFAESKLGYMTLPNLAGMETTYITLKKISNKELINVLKLDEQIEKEHSLKQAKKYYNEKYSFEEGV